MIIKFIKQKLKIIFTKELSIDEIINLKNHKIEKELLKQVKSKKFKDYNKIKHIEIDNTEY